MKSWSLRKMDWRGRVIAIVTVILIFLTLAVYAFAFDIIPCPWMAERLHNWVKPETEPGAVFAAWAGGLALFVIAGAFVAIVSLERPEQGTFDERARILFRRQPGRHIDYIVAKIREALEHYAESATITVSIREFDGEANKFRLARDSKLIVRSYIDDIDSTYTTEFRLAQVSAPPKGKEPNRLLFIRVNGEPVGKPELIQSELKRHVDCTISAGKTGEVHSLFETWQSIGEPHKHVARRYTQKMSITFDNQLEQDILVEFGTLDPVLKRVDSSKRTIERVATGRSKKVIEIHDVIPEVEAIEYYLRLA